MGSGIQPAILGWPSGPSMLDMRIGILSPDDSPAMEWGIS